VLISCAVATDRVIADRAVRTRRAIISRPVENCGSRIDGPRGIGAFGRPLRRGMRPPLATASRLVRCLLGCWPLAGRLGLGARSGLLSARRALGTGPLVPIVVGHGRPLTVHQHVARCQPGAMLASRPGRTHGWTRSELDLSTQNGASSTIRNAEPRAVTAARLGNCYPFWPDGRPGRRDAGRIGRPLRARHLRRSDRLGT
jgi:hypothetical protein